MSIKSLIPSLLVENIEKTVEYYTKTLGFSLVTKTPYWAHVSSGNADLYFTLKENVYSFLPEMKEKDMGGTFTLYISVKEIELYYNRIREKITISIPLHTTPYGMKEFQVKDINGYILDFGEQTESTS